MDNKEIVRMNLVGAGPELRASVKELATRVIREFNGAPENAREFNAACDLYELISEIDGDDYGSETEQPEIVLQLGGRKPGLYVNGRKM